MKILWLASWYPNEYDSKNGDFIQRHAQAVSQLMHIDVIHIVQAGRMRNSLNKIVTNNDENLHEAIHYFTYKQSNSDWLNKILYTKTYWRYYKNIFNEYIKKKGTPDLIHVHVPFKAGIVALAFSKKYNIPFIVSEHSSLYLKEAENNFYTRDFYFRFYTQQTFKKATVVTNVSKAIGDVLKQMFNIKDIRIIPNVVDTKYFFFKPKEKNEVFRWIHVSTMYPLKNVDKIIQAFGNILKQRNDWELILVGPAKAEYLQLVAQLSLQSKIKFTGGISYESVAQQMQQADALIMFSKHENFPCVIVEALCCGLPVVSSNVGGVAEAVDSSNGILVEANNTNELERAIISMMKNINSYNSKQIAEEASLKYNYEVVAAQFTSLYKEVLKYS